MQGRGSGSASRITAQAGARSEPGRRAGSGARTGSDPGHDQRHERDRQPGHPQLRQVWAERRLAVLRRHLQRLPGIQEEVRVLPDDLPPRHTDAGAVPAVPGDVSAGEAVRQDQVREHHGECLDPVGCLVWRQEPVHQGPDAGHQKRVSNKRRRRRAPDGTTM